MTIDQIIALAASIGACLSSIAAFLTISQVSKQRESSYRPELAVSRKRFQCIQNPLTAMIIPDVWVNEPDPEQQQNILNFFSVPLHNVGLGAAKSLTIKCSFQIEEAITKINQLAQKSLTPVFFELKDDLLSLNSENMGATTQMWINQKMPSIDFVLPASKDNSGVELIVPPAFILIVSALVYFHTKARDYSSFEEVPHLTVDIDYQDIGGKKHQTKVSLIPKISSVIGECESFQGYIESRNINS